MDCIRTPGVLPFSPLHFSLLLSWILRLHLLSSVGIRSLSTDSGSSDVPSRFLAWNVLPARPSGRLETPAFHPTPPSCLLQGCCQLPCFGPCGPLRCLFPSAMASAAQQAALITRLRWTAAAAAATSSALSMQPMPMPSTSYASDPARPLQATMGGDGGRFERGGDR